MGVGVGAARGMEAESPPAAEAGSPPPPARCSHSLKDVGVASTNDPHLPQLLKWFWSRKENMLLLARKCHFTSCLPFLSVQLENSCYLQRNGLGFIFQMPPAFGAARGLIEDYFLQLLLSRVFEF